MGNLITYHSIKYHSFAHTVVQTAAWQLQVGILPARPASECSSRIGKEPVQIHVRFGSRLYPLFLRRICWCLLPRVAPCAFLVLRYRLSSEAVGGQWSLPLL